MTMRQMHLNCMLGGIGLGAWRPGEADPWTPRDLGALTAMARTAERGLMDALFFGDLNSTAGAGRAGLLGLEPFTTCSALAAVTERIGLIVSASTTYAQPYNVARRLASLDHISQGRAGWNIVTTLVEAVAENYGREPHPGIEARYARAEEFTGVAKALWDSWDEEAVFVDAEGRTRVDGAKVRPIAHRGEHFAVRGPLDLSRPPQGRPVLAQAGSSGPGKAFAARHAEVIFTAQPTLPRAQAFRTEMRARAAAAGRNPDRLRVLPGFAPVLAPSEAEARDLAAALRGREGRRARLDRISGLLGLDLATLPPDAPIPPALLPDISDPATHSRTALFVEMIREEGLSPDGLLARGAHLSFVGTPEGAAELMERWIRAGAADGFTLMWSHMPGGLDLFVEEVIPRLQGRGVYRTAYPGRTLRETLGLERER
ncbi:NtaA/DmoA family FMN-dependent monooxygenase [Roseococcus pinisoli]|uniref:NtaA/DmoA family FMN-dependent monooxygenase n=1 Tax=Roseococcus pinisoli TaxID=2835040 RepID=A0ABS5QIW9_9PROT|nr:NtaA/DmoA family FMN-dependent monooxygenase [Roseococcus pinisoli]MBS7813631.1 NtaA/DmoA family FMN-dependent monooxygenase [Roseococcus pinisoli]